MPDSVAGTDAIKEMKHILVIGAWGFLGKHLALALHEKGYTVRCSVRDLSRVKYLTAPSPADAIKHFGFLGPSFGVDNSTSDA